MEEHDDEQEFMWLFVDGDMSVAAQGGGDSSGQQPHLSEDLVLRFGQNKGQSWRDVTERDFGLYFWATKQKQQDKYLQE